MTGSQHFVPLENIQDDLIFLKDGSVSLVITTSAVNFSLLFETEQISIIESFAGFLNSLSFPIQIIIRSQKLDVSSYLKTIDQAKQKQTNPNLRALTDHYRHFVASIIKENNVLDKQFYVCLNVTSIELGVLHKNLPDRSKKAITILAPRRDHVLRQLARLGLKSRQLNTVELIKLFFDIYNPEGLEELSNSEAYDSLKPPSPPILPPIPPAPPAIPLTNPSPKPLMVNPLTIDQPAPKPRPTLPPLARFPQTPAPPPTITQPGIVTQLSPPFVVEELPDDNGP